MESTGVSLYHIPGTPLFHPSTSLLIFPFLFSFNSLLHFLLLSLLNPFFSICTHHFSIPFLTFKLLFLYCIFDSDIPISLFHSYSTFLYLSYLSLLNPFLKPGLDLMHKASKSLTYILNPCPVG